ncbi:MAG: cyclodeaminase/cyclohydrolase family protein [Planctomycetes bacterium]|nr:cyclodeaminase/cyclohydrolase family protein [Planctomycetota bacterium]MCB9884694.1 cyclodeaminase/cyclohydrolase family protein [Planctomycetota bacterium]
MIEQPIRQFIESLAAKTPTPGGGAAAAMAGCMGTALFAMVVRFSRGKKANVDRDADLAAVEGRLDDLLKLLMPMAERDCRAFDLVSAAYGMPKASPDEQGLRDKAIQEAMVGAMVVPEEALCLVRDVFVAMESITGCIGKAIVSDLASGAALLLAAAEGAYLNVHINANFLKNRDLAENTMKRARSVLDEIRRYQQTIAVTVDGMLA